jgi:hypothetical protein
VEEEYEDYMLVLGYEHLPPYLKNIAQPFADLARKLVDDLPQNPEKAIALKKLLETKDCAVRTLVVEHLKALEEEAD